MTKILKQTLLFVFTTLLTTYIINIYFHDLLTKEQLAQYNGVHNKKLYLAILGKVYDVSRGAKYYGPGETYHTFVGQDNSKSFVTGEFGKSASDDILTFNNKELLELKHWIDFYDKEYTYAGKLIGRYYTSFGTETEYAKLAKRAIEAAEQGQINDNLEKAKYPPCNIEWDADKGSRVWCTKRSGGIERNWVGYPRQLYEVGAENYRCACIKDQNDVKGYMIREYAGCAPNSESCFVKAET